LSKRIEKASANFLHGSLDAATHSANSERALQVFLSAQLELTRTVSPCELKQTIRCVQYFDAFNASMLSMASMRSNGLNVIRPSQ
jgi:hypothetical protein